MNTVEIKSDNGIQYTVLVNGERISNMLSGLSLDIKAEELPKFTFYSHDCPDVLINNPEITIVFDVKTIEEAKKVLNNNLEEIEYPGEYAIVNEYLDRIYSTARNFNQYSDEDRRRLVSECQSYIPEIQNFLHKMNEELKLAET